MVTVTTDIYKYIYINYGNSRDIFIPTNKQTVTNHVILFVYEKKIETELDCKYGSKSEKEIVKITPLNLFSHLIHH